MRLKKWVIPTVLLVLLVASFITVSKYNKSLKTPYVDQKYSKSILKEVTQSVFEENAETSFVKPIVSDNVEKKLGYYDSKASKEEQESSLLYFENTYMPSTGVFYLSKEDFDVISVYDGKVVSIENDEVLGTYITIEHSNSLSTVYYSLKDVSVNVSDNVKQGTILGKGTANKIYEDNSLLFEVIKDGKTINPEEFYISKVNDLL